MSYRLICSQGRVGDKTDTTLRGAKLTAEALEQNFGIQATIIGSPSPGQDDNWKECLPKASKTLDLLQGEVQTSLAANDTVLFASNTCSASLATLPIVTAKYPDITVLWIDAHGDFNTPDTSETGYLGGMVLAAVCGLWESGFGAGLKPSQVVLAGVHDIDEKERRLLEDSGVRMLPPRNVTPETILEMVGSSKLWIHIDWDALEPGQIPADYKVHGGLYLSQLISVFEAIPREQVLGLELAEFSADDIDSEESKLGVSNILSVVNSLLGSKK